MAQAQHRSAARNKQHVPIVHPFPIALFGSSLRWCNSRITRNSNANNRINCCRRSLTCDHPFNTSQGCDNTREQGTNQAQAVPSQAFANRFRVLNDVCTRYALLLPTIEYQYEPSTPRLRPQKRTSFRHVFCNCLIHTTQAHIQTRTANARTLSHPHLHLSNRTWCQCHYTRYA